MTFRKRISYLLLCVVTLPALAAPPTALSVEEPRLPFWSIITDMPDTAWFGMKYAVSKKALPGWGYMLGSTAILYHYDRDLLEDMQAKGRSWDLGNSVNYKSVLKAGDTTLFSAPTDTAGWLYFMGDGLIPIAVSGAMITTGYIGNKTRAWNAGIEMFNALLVGGIFDQAIKRVTGRESPSRATEERGRFRPFPNLKEYSKDTAKYDAMPSGHIMSAAIMFAVLEEEYSEYNHILIPAEVAWLSILGFGMVNVGVHWASDYPMGIALGHLFGHAAVAIHHPEREKKNEAHWKFMPQIHGDSGTPLLGALYTW